MLVQAALRFGQADALARIQVGMTATEFRLIGGVLGAQPVFQVCQCLEHLLVGQLLNLRFQLRENHGAGRMAWTRGVRKLAVRHRPVQEGVSAVAARAAG